MSAMTHDPELMLLVWQAVISRYVGIKPHIMVAQVTTILQALRVTESVRIGLVRRN